VGRGGRVEAAGEEKVGGEIEGRGWVVRRVRRGGRRLNDVSRSVEKLVELGVMIEQMDVHIKPLVPPLSQPCLLLATSSKIRALPAQSRKIPPRVAHLDPFLAHMRNVQYDVEGQLQELDVWVWSRCWRRCV
jgi:hypothetical protein